MKIKKYVGSTAHEAMLKLKNELGPDAVVLNTKTIRAKGILKYFKQPLVEVTAAYEENDILRRTPNNKYENDLNSINQELIELKSMMKNLPLENEKDKTILSPLESFENIMKENGVDLYIAKEILGEINKQFNLKDKNSKTIKNIIKYNLMEHLGNPQPISMDGSKKTVFFIGPTGVGKTTTLAKIAASLVVKDKYKIGLITSDTYRVGAVDQLEIYSDILNLPLEIAYNEDDMYNAFDKFKDKDIILIDTAGRNHNDSEQVEELKNILNSRENKEVYLLLSATIDKRIVSTIVKKYEFLKDFKLIITKVDEAEDYGNILNIKHITNKELSYYTTGQSVPDDIQLINKEFIAKKLIEENSNNGSS